MSSWTKRKMVNIHEFPQDKEARICQLFNMTTLITISRPPLLYHISTTYVNSGYHLDNILLLACNAC